MGVSPSGVDDKHRKKILGQLEPDMFYIFMIWNKSLSIHALVYDMTKNILYENPDVEVKLPGDECLDEFLADAKKKVKKSGQRRYGTGAKKQTAPDDNLGYNTLFDMYDQCDLGGQLWGL
jgi:hypothetical protein